MSPRILIIEDEPAIADTIVYALRAEGFEPLWVATGQAGRERLAEGGFALLVLDIGLPDCNGFDLCRELRASSTIPVIFLTARASEIDRVAGLETGADDYMVKPFSPRELAARVRAVLRRAPATPPPVSTSSEPSSPPETLGAFTHDTARKAIGYYGTTLDLSRYEYRILLALIRRPGRVFSRRELMEQAWDEPDISLERTVDTHIKTIRRKLDDIRPGKEVIETKRGFGYAVRER